jgi:RNA polymerase sigma-54 factor
MSLRPRLAQTQAQSLIMTPQLQQAIKLLQLSSLDLEAYVEGELERNPLLARDEEDDGAPDAPGPAADTSPPADGIDTFCSADDLDTPSADLYPEAGANDLSRPDPGADMALDRGPGAGGLGATGGPRSQPFDDDGLDAAARLSREPTLREHLAAQLMMLPLSDPDRVIGMHLIELVDEAGYLTEDLETIAERLGTDAGAVGAVLERMQGFEPTGILARSLRECLTLQLAEHGELTARMTAFLDNLGLVARHDIPGLMRACDATREEIAEMAARLRRLNPKPGLQFSTEPLQPVVPDVLVRAAPDGSWLIELNSETLPRVLIDQSYYATVSRDARNSEEKAYLSECLTSAKWLVKTLDQRARTVLKVAQEIVRQQDAFLILGVRHLRPLNLKTVADAIDMHESTVSRVTANKYMATPRGIFEMKYFFTSAIPTLNGGNAVSAEAVRHRIREMIGNETPSEVLSDDRLVELLREAGIEIARRTVAKYREGMNIPSSVQRRRMKRAYAE